MAAAGHQFGDLGVDLRGGYARTDREAPFNTTVSYTRTNIPGDPYGGNNSANIHGRSEPNSRADVPESTVLSSGALRTLGRTETEAVCICSLGEGDRSMPVRFLARRLRRIWPNALPSSR